MRRIAHCPAQIGDAERAKPRQRVAAGRLRHRRRDFGPEPALRLLSHRCDQRAAAGKVAERRPRRHSGTARGLAYADRLRAALPDQFKRGLDQHPTEIAMVIGLWRRLGAGRPAVRLGGGRPCGCRPGGRRLG